MTLWLIMMKMKGPDITVILSGFIDTEVDDPWDKCC